jgi:hypothetical protein
MSDILTDEQVREIEAQQERLAEIGDYPYGDSINALLASHKVLQARVAALEAALKAIADGDAIEFAEKFGIEIPTCDTDWSYDGVYYERLHENIAWAALDQPVSQQPDDGEA